MTERFSNNRIAAVKIKIGNIVIGVRRNMNELGRVDYVEYQSLHDVDHLTNNNFIDHWNARNLQKLRQSDTLHLQRSTVQ